MAYLIKKNKNKEIIYMEYDLKGYKFAPKKALNIKQVNLINPVMINSVLSVKFNKVFIKLYNEVISIINDDDATTGDTMRVLGNLEKLRSIVLNKYQHFLSRERETLFLEKLRLLENQLKVKNMMINEALELERELLSEKGKSR